LDIVSDDPLGNTINKKLVAGNFMQACLKMLVIILSDNQNVLCSNRDTGEVSLEKRQPLRQSFNKDKKRTTFLKFKLSGQVEVTGQLSNFLDDLDDEIHLL